MSPACSRLFEVEAMRDGRLTGAGLASFGRHMTTCRACAHEAQALDTLVEEVRTAGVTDGPTDELHLARARTRLLADFDRSLVASKDGRPWRRLGWPAAGLALACGLLLVWRARQSTPVPTVAAVVVSPEADTIWSKRLESGRESVVLERGTLAIHVDHSIPRRDRLVVLLPDSELEDIGTTFTVTAADGHTQRVAVQDGSVLLRVRGRAPIALSAGKSWSSDAAPQAELGTRAEPAPAAGPPVPSAPIRPALIRSNRPTAPDETASSLRFRGVVRLLERGEACEAATGFAEFATSYPSDRRVEDAAYLRVIALQRCGSEDAMKRAAREYLSRYPAGFRRTEVDRLSR